jgi:putative membrane-bound dehydrogenase-like protein
MKQPSTITSLLLASILSTTAQQPAPQALPEPYKVPMLSPSDELKKIQLPEGYSLELVLSEPDVKEPAAIAFDGNGRMYVVEMRTYMQDADGSQEHAPVSRISRHESSKRNGVFDKHTVYLDNLLIPRMVLPLDDRVLVGVTDTLDITMHRDTNGDGVADTKETFYMGGPRGGNMEHQPSGLVWSMDNWIYTTYNSYRLRWSPKGALKEPTAPNGGQWGLAQDNFGKMWFNNAGGEKGLVNFQTHIAYAGLTHPDQQTADYPEVWPALGLPDQQGGPARHRPGLYTLNHFTATCGQEIFRGDRLPADLQGDILFSEPVGRLIRRTKINVEDGITKIRNAYDKAEFITSTDPNFRIINIANAPDGCLYFVDMYRGIVQESNWTKPGSYLRGVVEAYGLDKNVGAGRIWRLVHKDFKPGPQPRMLEESASQLVAHLEHPNGWWRDTAQKLLVVRADKSVVPALEKLVLGSKSPLARMHALWTLEGLDAATPAPVRAALKDADPQVRVSAIRVSETLWKAGDLSLKADIIALAKDADPTVALQVLLTGKLLAWEKWADEANKLIEASPSKGYRELGKMGLVAGLPSYPKDFSPQDLALLKEGETIFRELCFSCHGHDGKGMPLAGMAPGVTLAPPLAGSKTVTGPAEGLISVMLHGISGPLNGKTYEAQMVPLGTNPDHYLAAVGSYLRNSFSNRGSILTEEEVVKIRQATKDRAAAWTQEELLSALPNPLKGRDKWKATASLEADASASALDNKGQTAWTTKVPQAPGQWFQVELPQETKILGVRLEVANRSKFAPKQVKVELSNDGEHWSTVVAKAGGAVPMTELSFPPAVAKFVRITQLASGTDPWAIHELELIQPGTMFPLVTR